KKVSIRVQLLNRELVIEKRFLDKVKDNATVEIWFEETQQEKGDSLTEGLWDLILVHPDVRKRDVFALSIYRLVIFPKVLGHVDDAVSDLFNQLDKKVTPVLTILVETFRSLSACRRVGEGRFIGFCINVETLIESLYSGYRELLDMPLYLYRDSIGRGSLHRQRKGWLNVSLHTKIIKQDFKKKSSELGKRIGKLEEEKIQLGLDVKIQKLEAEKMKKRKKKGPPGWVKHWNNRDRKSKKKRVEMISGKRNSKMLESVAELERSLHQYCCHNSVIELKASLTKIEELKGKIEELEATLQNCEL
ncbi:hypothetical protein Goshw_020874, partial [Gossypium schwendimanii]|nr:hypothetical protein [Gossypium schwendimanii]